MLSTGWFVGAGCYGANCRGHVLDWVYIYMCVCVMHRLPGLGCIDRPVLSIATRGKALFIAYVPANRFGVLKQI